MSTNADARAANELAVWDQNNRRPKQWRSALVMVLGAAITLLYWGVAGNNPDDPQAGSFIVTGFITAAVAVVAFLRLMHVRFRLDMWRIARRKECVRLGLIKDNPPRPFSEQYPTFFPQHYYPHR